MINLRHLEKSDKASFLAAMNEQWESNFVFAHYYESLAHHSFEKYIQVLPLISLGQLITINHVPSTLLFAFDSSDKIIGRVSIRHQLNDLLLNVGGHVGYGVVPSRRREGFATEILKESLVYIKSKLPHLDRVLLTCDDSNLGSRKTIEKNGGELENIIKDSSMEVAKRRYWIKV